MSQIECRRYELHISKQNSAKLEIDDSIYIYIYAIISTNKLIYQVIITFNACGINPCHVF